VWRQKQIRSINTLDAIVCREGRMACVKADANTHTVDANTQTAHANTQYQYVGRGSLYGRHDGMCQGRRKYAQGRRQNAVSLHWTRLFTLKA